MPITVPFIPAGAMCIKPKSINRTFEEKPPLFHFRGNGCFTTGTLYVLFVSVGAFLGSGSHSCQLLCSGWTLGARWRDRRVGRQTARSQLRFWGLTRTKTRFHFILEDDLIWHLFYSCCIFLLYLWSMYLTCPLISRRNYTYYIIRELKII